jgi:hypothetical protein
MYYLIDVHTTNAYGGDTSIRPSAETHFDEMNVTLLKNTMSVHINFI